VAHPFLGGGNGHGHRGGQRPRYGSKRPLYASSHRKRVVRRFADPRSQITIPSSRVTAVHYTRDEAQLLCHVAPVLPDVVSAGCGVPVHKFADIAGLGKDVGGVPQLRDLGDDHSAAVLSREFGICARFFCEVAVDVADDGRVWGFGGRRREGVARLELAAKPLRRTATPNVVGCSGYQ